MSHGQGAFYPLAGDSPQPSYTMDITVTALVGRRSPDGRLEVEGLKSTDPKRFEELKREVIASRQSRYVMLRPEADRLQLAEQAYFAGHLVERDEAGQPKVDKKGQPVLRKQVSIPFQTKVDRKASPARMVTTSTIDLDEGRPEKLSYDEAFWLLNPKTYGKLVIECDRDGNPVQVDNSAYERPTPKKPGGRD